MNEPINFNKKKLLSKIQIIIDKKSAIKFQHSTNSPKQIPFGFFRARFQASAAIKKAVEKQTKKY